MHARTQKWTQGKQRLAHTYAHAQEHTRLTVTYLIPGSRHIWITAGWWGREGQAPPDWLASFKKVFLFSARLSDLSLSRFLSATRLVDPPTSRPTIWVASPPAQVNMKYAHLHLTQENDSSARASGAFSTPSSIHRQLIVSFRFCFLKVWTEGHNQHIYVRRHMMQFFSARVK